MKSRDALELTSEKTSVDAVMSEEDKIKEDTAIDSLTEDGDDKNQYSIFNYLKEHPSYLVAVFSASVAIITFFAQLATYIMNKNELAYWNIDVSYASLRNDRLLYTAIASIVYIIFMSLSTMFFTDISKPYMDRKKYHDICNLIYKRNKKECRQIYKGLIRNKKKYKQSYKNLKQSKNEVFEKECTDAIKKLNEIKTQIKDCTITNRRQSIRVFLNFIFKAITILTVHGIFSFVIILIGVDNVGNTFKIMVIMVMAQAFAFWFLFLLEYRGMLKKEKIKEGILNLNHEELYERIICKKEYSSFSFSHNGIKKWVSNYSIIAQIIAIVISCIIFVISCAINGTSANTQRDNLQITTIDNEVYAIVYREENRYFLEKADIIENKIIIYTNKQRIVTADDISFSVCTFEEIIKNDSEV